ncbi:MAG TPA: ribbon-helix-helix protein, CopG family [Methanosarcina sp.]|jgi:metal-responsive CopG/Arc/MetJ family transcriptional regulator
MKQAITITIDGALLKELDEITRRKYITRSFAIEKAVRKAMKVKSFKECL